MTKFIRLTDFHNREMEYLDLSKYSIKRSMKGKGYKTIEYGFNFEHEDDPITTERICILTIYYLKDNKEEVITANSYRDLYNKVMFM